MFTENDYYLQQSVILNCPWTMSLIHSVIFVLYSLWSTRSGYFHIIIYWCKMLQLVSGRKCVYSRIVVTTNKCRISLKWMFCDILSPCDWQQLELLTKIVNTMICFSARDSLAEIQKSLAGISTIHRNLEIVRENHNYSRGLSQLLLQLARAGACMQWDRPVNVPRLVGNEQPYLRHVSLRV